MSLSMFIAISIMLSTFFIVLDAVTISALIVDYMKPLKEEELPSFLMYHIGIQLVGIAVTAVIELFIFSIVFAVMSAPPNEVGAALKLYLTSDLFKTALLINTIVVIAVSLFISYKNDYMLNFRIIRAKQSKENFDKCSERLEEEIISIKAEMKGLHDKNTMEVHKRSIESMKKRLNEYRTNSRITGDLVAHLEVRREEKK